MVIEVCIGSYEDALIAARNGARRVELNSALHLGGCTPSSATLKLIKQNTSLEVMCMVRSRGEGFYYNVYELEEMFEQARELLLAGADGIVFGFLNKDNTINIEASRRMVELIHSYQKTAVFHRAFDITDDPVKAIEQLIAMGVDRVLTSGQKVTAVQGIDLLKKLNDDYGDKITILAGCGVNAQNAKVFETAGIKEIHASCKNYRIDPTSLNREVDFSFEHGYEVTDEDKLIALLEVFK